MPIIDVHAHLTPERYKAAIEEKGTWYGLDARVGELHQGRFAQPLEQRLANMDEQGVEMQLLSPTIGFTQYENDVETAAQIARECNDEIADTVTEHPDRFLGLGTVPMQDIDAAITELERIMRDLRFKGVIIRDHVLGKTFDEPEFRPFFKAAEDLGALLFFHQGGGTVIDHRVSSYKLGNAIGNLTERAIAFATLVFGRVMDDHPNLKPLLGHAGGYTAFGVKRMDKVAGAFEGGYPDQGLEPPFGNDDMKLTRPPSTYLSEFYYDCCIYDEEALRFLVDRVGADRVLLGTDYPAPMFLIDPVRWLRSLDNFTDQEKDAILSENASKLLGA